MEEPVTALQLFVSHYLGFLVFHFVLYAAFWVTGPAKFMSTLKD
ncbi:hypothetical protein SH661x_001623 [Planctomicrobium sp. SH661]